MRVRYLNLRLLSYFSYANHLQSLTLGMSACVSEITASWRNPLMEIAFDLPLHLWSRSHRLMNAFTSSRTQSCRSSSADNPALISQRLASLPILGALCFLFLKWKSVHFLYFVIFFYVWDDEESIPGFFCSFQKLIQEQLLVTVLSLFWRVASEFQSLGNGTWDRSP